MELIFNDAKIRKPKHLERCLCYDKFLKGYRCYVYDDISKYWCTQATTEHDPDGENHIVDYADYQVTEWASLQQEQLPGIEDQGIPGKDFIPVDWVDACEKYGKWKIVKVQ